MDSGKWVDWVTIESTAESKEWVGRVSVYRDGSEDRWVSGSSERLQRAQQIAESEWVEWAFTDSATESREQRVSGSSKWLQRAHNRLQRVSGSSEQYHKSCWCNVALFKVIWLHKGILKYIKIILHRIM